MYYWPPGVDTLYWNNELINYSTFPAPFFLYQKKIFVINTFIIEVKNRRKFKVISRWTTKPDQSNKKIISEISDRTCIDMI